MHIGISFIILYLLIQGASIVPFDYTNTTMCVQHVVHITLHPLYKLQLVWHNTSKIPYVQSYLYYACTFKVYMQSRHIDVYVALGGNKNEKKDNLHIDAIYFCFTSCGRGCKWVASVEMMMKVMINMMHFDRVASGTVYRIFNYNRKAGDI